MKKATLNKLTVNPGITHALGHDMKQPLGLIRAYSYYIKKMLPQSAHSLTEYTEKIERSVDLISSMLNNVVESIKLENNQVVYKDEVVDVAHVLQSLIAELQSMYPELSFKTDINISDSTIRGDELYMRLALLNILDNAARFSPVSKPILIGASSNDNHISITCTNAGPAIPQDEQPRIFEPYYKAQNAHQSVTKGLGTGLFVAHNIVLHHKGSLTITSTPKKTRVIITLPR